MIYLEVNTYIDGHDSSIAVLPQVDNVFLLTHRLVILGFGQQTDQKLF